MMKLNPDLAAAELMQFLNRHASSHEEKLTMLTIALTTGLYVAVADRPEKEQWRALDELEKAMCNNFAAYIRGEGR